MNPHLKVLAAVLVLVRRADDRVTVLLGRQWNRTSHSCVGPHHRLDNLLSRLIDDLVIVRLQPDPDLLLVGHV